MKNNESGIEVVLDIFSGRPNPKWTLSEKQINELREKLVNLPPSQPVIPVGLGYRGVVVTNLPKNREIPNQIRVYNSILAVIEMGKTTYYKDVNNIEEWLLNQAREMGYGDVIEKFRR